ncbi:MAG: DUF5329 family protein [Leptospirales bacterium]|jgi:hypothetical protein
MNGNKALTKDTDSDNSRSRTRRRSKAFAALGLATCVAMMSFRSVAIGAVGLESEPPLTEAQKIDLLIQRVETSGGTFVRNGSEHSAEAAAAHMRLKLSRAGSVIKTAENFIQYIATKSSFTGVAYRIKFPDGREYKSADWLRARLAEIERAAGDDDCCSLKR